MSDDDTLLKLGLPKGHIKDEVFALLGESGIRVRESSRNYRPSISLSQAEAKLMKPQNVIGALAGGSRDVGFAGADWVEELDADLVELLDTGLDPVRLVAAAPEKHVGEEGKFPDEPLVVASEYEHLTQQWIDDRDLRAEYVRSFGATEAFPPEDADCIVDNSATGATLEANDLVVIDELMTSSTRLYTTASVLEDPAKREAMEDLVLLLESVLRARDRVTLEVNVSEDQLEEIVDILPCMREPTVSPLHHDMGYAIKVAMPKEQLPAVIPKIKSRGGADIVATSPSHIIL